MSAHENQAVLRRLVEALNGERRASGITYFLLTAASTFPSNPNLPNSLEGARMPVKRVLENASVEAGIEDIIVEDDKVALPLDLDRHLSGRSANPVASRRHCGPAAQTGRENKLSVKLGP